jgi:hypothetical protein
MERGIYLETRRALRVCSSVRQTTDLCRVRLFLKQHQLNRLFFLNETAIQASITKAFSHRKLKAFAFLS